MANSYAAFFSPEEFSTIVKESFLTNFPVSAEMFVKLIGASDGIVGLLLILGLFRKYVSAYATLWIVGVIAVSGFGDISSTVEHLGILAMPIYLFLTSNSNSH